MAYSANQWQPVHVPGPGEPEASPPPSRDGGANNSAPSLKRFGTSPSWKGWMKASKARKDAFTTSVSLLACDHGWKPYTMRKRVLAPMAIWTVALAAVIEFFAQKSSREGGLALSQTVDDIPGVVKFNYEFLPTIIAVILSIAWTWVDLDVKRIQPWLAMSKKEGARLQDSLTLDYPYDFVALAPYKAAKRRHWTVFVSGTVMVLIFWVITPLQGAIFGTGPVQLREPSTFYASKDLIPIEDQAFAIDTSIIHRLFAVRFLDQPYPQFSTPEYTLRPFQLKEDSTPGAKNWTATTTKFWTDLNCEAADSITQHDGAWAGHFAYNNGKGCNASLIATTTNDASSYNMHYLAWYTSAYATQAFGVPTCSSEFSDQFLAIASKGKEENATITALFCQPSYWKQRVTVSVSDDTFHPLNSSVTPDGPVEELPASEFNSTGFQFLLGSSVSSVQQDSARDYPDNLLVNMGDRLNGTGVHLPLDPMVAFALSGTGRSMDDYLDGSVMEEAYRGVHKSAFVVAYNALLTTATASNETTEGSIEFIRHGVLVSRVFSAIVEGLLLTVGACCILLAVLSARVESKLSGNPAALSDQMNVLRNSPELLSAAVRERRILEQGKPSDTETARLHLQCPCESSDATTTITVTGLPSQPEGSDVSSDKEDDQYEPVSPIALKRSAGFAFTILLAAAFAGLLALRFQEKKFGGLPRPTESFEVLQLLENYIPTAIATMIEPYWVLVNRLLCVFQPYNDLHKAKKGSRAKRAVRAKYASVPPQLTLGSAARAGHIMLATVCVIALLGNVLAVGFGGLFSEKPINTSYPVDLQFQQSHKFDAGLSRNTTTSRVHEHFFGLKANITFGTEMAPWVSREYYFQPFAPSTPSDENSTETYKGRTRGYGVDISCDEMTPYRRVGEVDIMDFRSLYAERPRGSPTTGCDRFYNATWTAIQEGSTALEGSYIWCENLFVFWGRSASDPEKDRDMRYYSCRPKFKTAPFDVSVDSKGRIFSWERAGDFEDDLGYDGSRNHTEILLKLDLDNMSRASPNWHNDTLSRGWYPDIMKAAGDEWFLDPSEPLPDPAKVLPLIEGIWKRSFAALLANSDVVRYAPLEGDEPTFSGTRFVTETRIFMSEAAFVVSAVILALYLVVAVILYTFMSRPPVPRMPTSLGAVIQFTAPSRAVREYTTESQSHLRFGGYIGVDGKRNVGIEYSELIMPVEKAPRLQKGGIRRRWGWKRQRGSSWDKDRVRNDYAYEGAGTGSLT